jgi:hypothetical protein
VYIPWLDISYVIFRLVAVRVERHLIVWQKQCPPVVVGRAYDECIEGKPASHHRGGQHIRYRSMLTAIVRKTQIFGVVKLRQKSPYLDIAAAYLLHVATFHKS